jgi:purine-nucleoside phosphorylase
MPHDDVETATILRQRLDESLRAIAQRTAAHPTIGVILGSGLGGLTSALDVEAAIDYEEIPNLPRASAPGHEGKLVIGSLGPQRLAVLAGRFHYYEGYSMTQVTYPVRLAWALGIRTLILTSIVGSMTRDMPPGSLVLLSDHINLMNANPLIGPNDETIGPRFPDMSEPYDPALRQLALDVARAQRIPLREGVYVALAGPNLETRAEYRMLRQMGADVVGMSMVPEVLVARHSGLRVLAVTVVSDACIPEELKPASVEELLRVAAATEPKLTTLLKGVISHL